MTILCLTLGLFLGFLSAPLPAEESRWVPHVERQESFREQNAKSSIPFLAEGEVCSLPSEAELKISSWQCYKISWGVEKLSFSMPADYSQSRTETYWTLYAYEGPILYSIGGYYPAIANLMPMEWFNGVIQTLLQSGYFLISQVRFQVATGDWMMDYLAQDILHGLLLKGRAILTAFNGYTIQSIKPISGHRDCWDYFLESVALERPRLIPLNRQEEAPPAG